jgi:hypothetical protein
MNKKPVASCWHAGFYKCKALEGPNSCITACPFYITEKDSIKSLSRANSRLGTLPEEQQAHISGKYYYGERPWITGGKGG